jgi:holo-[acyl-carrier protein] synthase
VIIGIGVDVVDINRLGASLARTPNLRDRLFHETERELSLESLAGRFAAKEALAKALGDPRELSWSEIAVVTDELGKPSFALSGGSAAAISARAAIAHLSLSHDAGVATAFVVLEAS